MSLWNWNCSSAFSPFDVWFFGLHGCLDLTMHQTVTNQVIAALHLHRCTPGKVVASVLAAPL